MRRVARARDRAAGDARSMMAEREMRDASAGLPVAPRQGTLSRGNQMANMVKKNGNQPQARGETMHREPVRADPFQRMREWIGWDPLQLLQLSPRTMGREVMWNPSFEVRETDNAFVFTGDLPGLQAKDIDIQLVGNRLQISGKREDQRESEEGTLHTYERVYGDFSRTFALPEIADIDRSAAT